MSDFSLSSFLFSIIPISLLVVLMVHLKKRNENKKREDNKFGRKGRKDHKWLILKDYLKQSNKFGYQIEESHVFERPNPREFRKFLIKGLIYRASLESRIKGIKYKKPKFPKKLEVEEYFENLSKETANLNKEFLRGPIRGRISESKKDSINREAKRKRFVIVYKEKRNGEISEWKAVEVEMLKKLDKTGKNTDAVVLNKELDCEKESYWIAPLLASRIEESIKKKDKKKKAKKN